MPDESKANLLFSLHNERRHNEQLRKQLEQAQEALEKVWVHASKGNLSDQERCERIIWDLRPLFVKKTVLEPTLCELLENKAERYRQALEEITSKMTILSGWEMVQIACKALEGGQSEN